MVCKKLRTCNCLLTELKHIAVIGGSGMLGSDLVRYFQTSFRVTSIDKTNYDDYKRHSFDIIINANGNSRRYWANKNPQQDFLASTVSVYNSFFDFHADAYIYISSPDVYPNPSSTVSTKEDEMIDSTSLGVYGFHKYLSENIVKKFNKNFLILRPAMILGTRLKKGPVYDILHGHPLYITLSSTFQFITTEAIARIIVALLEMDIRSTTINVGGKGAFSFTKISDYIHYDIQVSAYAEKQIYHMNVDKLQHIYPSLKSSKQYLEDFLRRML